MLQWGRFSFSVVVRKGAGQARYYFAEITKPSSLCGCFWRSMIVRVFFLASIKQGFLEKEDKGNRAFRDARYMNDLALLFGVELRGGECSIRGSRKISNRNMANGLGLVDV